METHSTVLLRIYPRMWTRSLSLILIAPKKKERKEIRSKDPAPGAALKVP